jgi:uncharacterized repeat protein (TIGR01451 family)
LPSGGIKIFEFSPQGKTLRLQVEQAAGHPSTNQLVSAAVEGCGGTPTIGMVTQFSQNDNEPYLDTDCRQNVGAYDPNEKLANPVGFGTNRLIDQNTEIEYQINFQNEGSDTAFTVVLRDTIDRNFNLTTLALGASSHKYSFSIEDKNTLKVTFDNINLTTKKQNETLSQGFVRYRIAQNLNVPLGTALKNRAGIYFDFNKPIMTNTVTHTIGKNFVKTVAVPDKENSAIAVSVYPNPFREYTIFELQNTDNQFFTLRIYNQTGQLIHQKQSSSNQILFNEHLSKGVYFYTIEQNGKKANGKLLVSE